MPLGRAVILATLLVLFANSERRRLNPGSQRCAFGAGCQTWASGPDWNFSTLKFRWSEVACSRKTNAPCWVCQGENDYILCCTSIYLSEPPVIGLKQSPHCKNAGNRCGSRAKRAFVADFRLLQNRYNALQLTLCRAELGRKRATVWVVVDFGENRTVSRTRKRLHLRRRVIERYDQSGLEAL